MATTVDAAEGNPIVQLTAKDYKGLVDPDWCPGCGDFGVLNSLQRACAELGLKPHEIVTVSGIGCSSNFPGYFNSYGMHTLHGRALAVATGVKMANHELNVVVTTGDGDGYGIGGNHFTHTARKNIDLTYLVMNNQIYGLTTGQTSPTSMPGMKTKSTPFGNVETPLNPLTSAIMNGATYVARGYSGDIRQLTNLVKGGIEHRGFALIDIFSPCTTFNKDNDHPFFKQRVKKLEEMDHDTSDWKIACERAMEWGDTLYTGLFFKKEGETTLDDREPILKKGGPIATRELGVSNEQAQKIISGMM
ncbi:MAG: 2-oxoacid:ferredoxin oxidoreductase subunit beta [Chloroflexi bacterium]|nr:2-oxoacid:ferredoxin oxidoreductase subunit beta [Chloroflexota bacterium]